MIKPSIRRPELSVTKEQKSAYAKAWYAANAGKVRAKVAAYRAANLAKVKANNAAWASANAEKVRRDKAAWTAANAEKVRAQKAAWAAANAGKVLARTAAWQAANPDKVRANLAAYRARSPHKINARAAKRRASKRQSTPAWADHVAISQYYLIASFLTAELGIEFHVDHVVPLQSKTVCGLHAHTNMAIALGSWNMTKGNKTWPDQP